MIKNETVTDEELIEALEKVKRTCSFSGGSLHSLLSLVVDRLVETAEVFNGHEHSVSGVRTESCEYYSAGDGHTGTPQERGGYGCGKNQRIGSSEK